MRMAFTPWVMPCVAAFGLSAALLAYVLRRNRRSRANRAFAVWMAFLSVWTFGRVWMHVADDAASALFWAKFLYVGALFTAPAFAYFVCRLVGKKISAALLFMPFVPLAIALPTDLLIRGVRDYGWGYHFEYGVLFPLFGVFALSLLLYASHVLWQARKHVPSRLARKKLDILAYSTFATVSLIGVLDIILPSLGSYVYTIPNLLAVLLGLGIAYAFLIKR